MERKGLGNTCVTARDPEKRDVQIMRTANVPECWARPDNSRAENEERERLAEQQRAAERQRLAQLEQERQRLEQERQRLAQLEQERQRLEQERERQRAIIIERERMEGERAERERAERERAERERAERERAERERELAMRRQPNWIAPPTPPPMSREDLKQYSEDVSIVSQPVRFIGDDEGGAKEARFGSCHSYWQSLSYNRSPAARQVLFAVRVGRCMFRTSFAVMVERCPSQDFGSLLKPRCYARF